MALWGAHAEPAVPAMLPAVDVVVQRVPGRGYKQSPLLPKKVVRAPAPGNLLRRGIVQAAHGRRCDQLRGILFGENILAEAVLRAIYSTGKLHCMQTCPLQAWLEDSMSCFDDLG